MASSESFLAHLAKVQTKMRKRLELTSQLTAIKEVYMQYVDPCQIESVLCVKHGLHVTAQLQLPLKSIPPILSTSDITKLLDIIFIGLGLNYSTEEQNLIVRRFAQGNITAPAEQFLFLSPPIENCIKCNTRLLCHNKPSEVTVYKLDGSMKALNICWRCETCNINYNYSRFGNTNNGYRRMT